ncbi:MAG: SUF system NifU family Fe-S cluster assembly protein [Propionibacteriaceae bacterium]|jgi:nitrogen fixation NifU-like protein|nr:SUF system NifU family Fe-S cluster assembly protein [Propionibacteriaceae bacterium]
MDVQTLYQDIILDHYKAKHHSGLRQPYDVEVGHVNPSCGDELTLRLTLDGQTITDVSYEAVGCAISQASTSIMTDLVIGRSLDQAGQLYDGFQAMLEGQGKIELDEDVYGDAIAFHGVAQFPARVKCALLGWAALRDAMARSQLEESA